MILKHAYLNIIRTKSRNSLIMIIMIMIALTATMALSIQSSTDSLVNASLSQLSVEATIQVDREKIFSTMTDLTQQERNALLRSVPLLSYETLQLFATAESVNDFVVTQSTSLSALDFSPVDINDTLSLTTKGSNGEFMVLGYDRMEAMSDFTNGNATLVEGEMFDLTTGSNEVIIHQSLALLNDFQIGDTIQLINPRNPEEIISLVISGIYSTTQNDESVVSPLNDPSNRILLSMATLNSILNDSIILNPEKLSTNDIIMSQALTLSTNAIYYFDSIAEYENFEVEATSLGLDLSTYSISSSNLKAFEQSIQPLEQMANTSMTFLLLTLGVGISLLILFQIFIVKQRQYDIGVYAAIGMKKSKIAQLFVTESLLLASFSIAIGVFLGVMTTPIISDVLLSDAIEQAQIEQTTISQNFNRPGGGSSSQQIITDVSYIDSLQVSIDTNTLFSLVGLALVITMISSSIGVMSIARYEPLQILSER
jgi:putative ABC transport system permease protein